MAITEQTDQVAQAQALLIEHFKNSPNLKAVIKAYIDQLQEIEAMMFQLLEERDLTSAVGSQLDVLGEILGRPRNGLSDADYRSFLNAQIVVNFGSGTLEDVRNAIQLVTITTGTVTIDISEDHPTDPAHFEVVITEPITAAEATSVAAVIADAKGTAIRGIFTYWIDPTADVFEYDDGPGYDVGEYATAIGIPPLLLTP